MRTLQRSFAGGEIAPEMFGRLDLGKYQTGLQLCRNMRTLAHGPATRRAGFYWVNEVRDSTKPVRLIPFIFSATQALQIELGEYTARFHSAAGTVLETNKAITAIAGATLSVAAHGYTTGDDVFVSTAGGAGRFLRLTVVAAGSFTVADRWGAAVSLPASIVFVARIYTIATPWAAVDLAALDYMQDSDVLTITSLLYPATELRRLAATNWTVQSVSFASGIAAPTDVSAVATSPVPTNPITQSYVVTSVAADSITESVASSVVTATNNLSLYGNFNTISWSAATGAGRYYVYKLRGGSYGYIGQTTDLTMRDDNILPDSLQTPPVNNIVLNASVGNYPGAVAYFEQRRWFAGTTLQPQNVWATRSATDSNLSSSVPSRDDDALAFRIKSQQQNAIQRLVPLIDLMALTAGGEFRLFADGGASITPGTLSIKPQSYAGAAAVRPALTSASALYVQAQGSRVRELTFNPYGAGSYKSDDASIFAPHLFNGFSITEMAYTRAPDQTLWAVRNDGTLLGLTHVPDQQVYGWHRHDTDGTFEACSVIPEANEDALYVVVKRTINGRAVRYIERQKSRLFTQAKDAFFVDCGLTYSGAATTTVSGLDHLEGKTVSILADGAVSADQVVTAGVVSLAVAASTIQIGLKYTSDGQTLPAVLDQVDAAGQGRMKNVQKIHLRVAQSSVVKAGPGFDRLTTYPARAVTDPYGSAPALITGELSLAIGPSWNTDGSVCFRQDLPLPLTVLSLSLELQVGG